MTWIDPWDVLTVLAIGALAAPVEAVRLTIGSVLFTGAALAPVIIWSADATRHRDP
jgi:hypothetical protein